MKTMTKTSMTISVSRDLKEKIVAMAGVNGCSSSAVVVRLIMEGLKNYKTRSVAMAARQIAESMDLPERKTRAKK